MPESLSAADEAVVQRRRFLRGGALAAAAAAGGAVIAGASSAVPASAATGENLVIGQGNTGTTPTALRADGAGSPTFQLSNATGPTLLLNPYTGDIDTYRDADVIVGAVINTKTGPYIGLSDEDDHPYLGYLATGDDLVATPYTEPVEPRRIWDSKAKKGTVVGTSSSSAIDSKGRLVKGAWVDLKVAATDGDTTPVAAFLTVASSGSSKDGFFSVYAPGSRPSGTISAFFLKGKTMAGTAYAALGVDGKAFTVRVYASQTTYVTVDLSGLTSYGYPGPDFAEPAAQRASGRAARTASARKARAPR